MEVLGDDMFDLMGMVGPATRQFRLEDTPSMKVACTKLWRSLDPGKCEECLQ
jgi:hypothetical protein